MGIFSLFGKKDDRQASPDDDISTRPKRSSSSSSGKSSSSKKSGSSHVTRTAPPKRDPQAALATALKIDAIESEMSSEFVSAAPRRAASGASARPVPAKAETPAPPKPAAEARKSESKPESKPVSGTTASKPPRTLPPLEMGTTTQFLLDGASSFGQVAFAESEASAVIEEAAIMYANGQADLVEQMLRNAIEEDLLGDGIAEAWLMLFDLYQIKGKQQEFEQLSISYASRFETSPPAWTAAPRQDAPQSDTGSSPAVPFAGKLDAGAGKIIDRIAKLAETHRSLRLDFMRVPEVDAQGCGLLLKLLQRLHKSGHELVLVGAPELAEKIRAILEVGRRDDTEDAWLLMLELYRLLDREKDFEEASIDYCVTFEVSPPAFVSPQGKVTTAAPEPQQAEPAPGDVFLMPQVIEGRIDNLILSIASYSDEHTPAILDCSQLERVDFNAAGRLLSGLGPFCNVGRILEFHHVNHLVAALFNTIGLKDIARVFPRKG